MRREEKKINVTWNCSMENWINCNTDGASKRLLNKAGCGGVLRDHNGRWLCGFCEFLGYCNSLVVEL